LLDRRRSRRVDFACVRSTRCVSRIDPDDGGAPRGHRPREHTTDQPCVDTQLLQEHEMARKNTTSSKNTICLWYDGAALDAARFYAETFPDSAIGAVLRAPGDYPD